jgi:phage terminase large subunit GpA-like protein
MVFSCLTNSRGKRNNGSTMHVALCPQQMCRTAVIWNIATARGHIYLLAQGWRAEGDEVDEGALRVEDFGLSKIPPEVLCITFGADVQDSRIEVSYCGHARDNTSFVLAHQVIYGPVTADGVWQDLDDALKQRFSHPQAARLALMRRLWMLAMAFTIP